MAEIALLDQSTIDKIAAGEVVERPSSVVKELVENSMDAGATAVTVEIKEGGISFIRITDNGCGIPKEQVSVAFLRHSTSKIKSVEDLLNVSSLGFRGEALSSIAAVAQVELITKTIPDFTGVRYVIEGSAEKEKEEIGAPDGTTILVRNLFYNTPARRKFLKSPQTEAGYISTLVERLALSRPDISFKLIVNNQTKLHTSGNCNAKDVIYQIYGRELTAALIPVEETNECFSVKGFIGTPLVSRGNRNFENYFINRRYVKSRLIAKSLEDAYKSFLMQHQYPFCVLYFTFEGEQLDVNVHPAKMELRFHRQEEIYQKLYDSVRELLLGREHIKTAYPETKTSGTNKPLPKNKQRLPEPFEKKRLEKMQAAVQRDSPYEPKYPGRMHGSPGSTKPLPDIQKRESKQVTKEQDISGKKQEQIPNRQSMSGIENGQIGEGGQVPKEQDISDSQSRKSFDAQGISGTKDNQMSEGQLIPDRKNSHSADGQDMANNENNPVSNSAALPLQAQQPYIPDASGQHAQNQASCSAPPAAPDYVQEELVYEGKFLSEISRRQHKIIGQLFGTYWLVEYDEKLFIIDQHAAHEKVLYEKTLGSLKEKESATQLLSPPMILTLDNQEEQALSSLGQHLNALGFEIEPFGGREYAVCGVPGNLFGLDARQILLEILDSHPDIKKSAPPKLVLEKIASMSCKAAVKGNHALSPQEAKRLIAELLELENPYFCPHGRPTIISMGKYEIEKKFKRIV